MKECKKRDKILEYIEGVMIPAQRVLFEGHLNECEFCRSELAKFQKLYKIIGKDEVFIPEIEFFERIKENIRKEQILIKRPHRKFLSVLVPVFGLVLFLILFNFKKEQSVEIPVSIVNLLYDENLNSLLLERVVDDELMKQFNLIEEYLGIEPAQFLLEIDQDERQEFIKVLFNKYGGQYL